MFTVLALICVFMWAGYGNRRLWPHVQDDAYYYYVVAHNLTHGNGLTFDGENPTNGFHPLWLAAVLPIFAAFELGSGAAIAIVQVMSMGAYGCTIALLAGTALRMGVSRRVTLLMAIASLFAPFVSHAASGMEGTLTLPLLALIMRYLTHQPSILDPTVPERRRFEAAVLGILLGLVILSRLDTAFMVVPFAVLISRNALGTACSWSRRLLLLLRRQAAIFGPMCALLVPYCLWNFLYFGHVVPISGALKSTFPHPGWHAEWISEFPHWFGLLGPMALWAGLALTDATGPPSPSQRRSLLCLVSGSFLHAAYTLVFCDWAVHGWHFVQYIPVALLAGALAMTHVASRLRMHGLSKDWFVPLVTVLALVLVSGSVVLSVAKVLREQEFAAAAYDAADWAKRKTAPGTQFAMSDCGTFAYYSGRPVVNLDGVINSWRFQQILASGRLQEYLGGRGVRFVVHHFVPTSNSNYRVVGLRFPARLYRGKASVITINRRDEVFRSMVYEGGRGTGFLAIWRLPLPDSFRAHIK